MRRKAVFTIPKASTPEHVEENAGAGDLQLAPEEAERIDAAFPQGGRHGRLPML